MDYQLEDLGPRICIIGPSCSGKSTLAKALAERLRCPVYHLDQLAHRENTNWERRPHADFLKDHHTAIFKNSWVIDGNYFMCMPERFSRATAIIWLDMPLMHFLYHYIRRCFQPMSERIGVLKGAKKDLSWLLIRHSFMKYPKNRLKYQKLLRTYNKPLIHIFSISERTSLYENFSLKP